MQDMSVFTTLVKAAKEDRDLVSETAGYGK